MTDRSAAQLWASFPHDPRDPAVAPLRASDADRALIQNVLTDAFADGRLDRDEYDERAASVLSSRTLGELPAIVADLVPEHPLVPATLAGRGSLAAAGAAELQQRAEEKWRRDRTEALSGFLLPTVICWVIWSIFMPGGFPWPLFPMIATFINVVRVTTSKRDIIAAEVRRLEKKQAKELEARNKKQQ